MGAAQIIFLLITVSVATFVPKTRILMMIFNTSVSMIGMILVWQLDENNQKGRLTGLSLAAVFACNIPLALSLIASNVAGFTKRSVTSALIFVAYCVGNIVGPQMFLESEEPQYDVCSSHPSFLPPLSLKSTQHHLCISQSKPNNLQTGMAASVAGLALGIFFLTCLLVYYIWENKRRDAKYGTPVESSDAQAIAEGMSDKTDLEIESFRYML
jgi:hypothetical protein